MTIHLMKPPYIVDAGPCSGVYLSEEAYGDHLKRSGIRHPLDVMGEEMKIMMPAHTGDPEIDEALHEGVEVQAREDVRPVNAELCSPDEADQKFQEFFERYTQGGGSNLRVELVSGLTGIRFTLVSSWDDMG